MFYFSVNWQMSNHMICTKLIKSGPCNLFQIELLRFFYFLMRNILEETLRLSWNGPKVKSLIFWSQRRILTPPMMQDNWVFSKENVFSIMNSIWTITLEITHFRLVWKNAGHEKLFKCVNVCHHSSSQFLGKVCAKSPILSVSSNSKQILQIFEIVGNVN